MMSSLVIGTPPDPGERVARDRQAVEKQLGRRIDDDRHPEGSRNVEHPGRGAIGVEAGAPAALH